MAGEVIRSWSARLRRRTGPPSIVEAARLLPWFRTETSQQVHALREENVRALVQLLRDHARRENLTLYPWAAAQPRGADDDTWLW